MSADKASEIARLRQENERLRVEHGARHIKSRSRSLPEPGHELPLHQRPQRCLYGAVDVRRARGLAGWLLGLARSPLE